MLDKKQQRLRRARQTRVRIAQQSAVRLTVHRTNLNIYATVISGCGTKVLATASTAEKEVRNTLGGEGKGGNAAAAAAIGKRIAEKAKAAGVDPTKINYVAFSGGGEAMAAILGNQVEGGNSPGYQNVQRCTTQTRYDNQFLGYDVVYEYGGRQYSTRTQQDPGQWIPVTVQPAVAPAAPPSSYPQGYGYGYDSVQPGVVVTETPIYTSPVYVSPSYGATIEYNRGGGWDHGYRRHWR